MTTGGHVHIITTLDVGGAELTLYRLLRASARLRQNATVISLAVEGKIAASLRGIGVTVVSLGIRPAWPDPTALLRTVALLRRRRPAVVQSWLYHADLLALLACDVAFRRSAARPRLYWNIRAANVDLTMYSRGLGWVMRAGAALSARPDAIVVNSEPGREAHERFGYAPRRWEVIPNGVDTTAFAPNPALRAAQRSAIGVPDDAVLIGSVGRSDPLKAQHLFTDAVAHVLRRHARVHVLGVGRNLEQVLTFPPALHSRVHLVGEQREVAPWLNACDLVVSTSSSEGFPNVIAEAMSCGVPCISTPSGVVSELIGETGLVVSDASEGSVASACEQLVVDADQRQHLGRQARLRIESNYAMDRMVARYEALYRPQSDKESPAVTPASTGAN